MQNTCESDDPSVVSLCLQVVGKYVLWIDINLVANDRFVPVLVKLLSHQALKEAAADCIHDIIMKGMDPIVKAKLIESFSSVLASAGIWQQLKVWYAVLR